MALRKTSITLQPEIEAMLMDLRKKFSGSIELVDTSKILAEAVRRMHAAEFSDQQKRRKPKGEK